MKVPKNTSTVLRGRADKLIKRIFRYLPCAVCLSFNRTNTKTVPAHLLRRSTHGYYKFHIWNIIPLCDNHHTKDKEISSHAWGGDTGVIKNFDAWLKNTLPKHYQWREDHKNNAPLKLIITELAEIVEDLEYYAAHSLETENLIYER